MKSLSATLWWRAMLSLAGNVAITSVVVTAFASRLLLIDPGGLTEAAGLYIGVALVVLVADLGLAAVLTVRLSPVLETMMEASTSVTTANLFEVADLPGQVAWGHIVVVSAASFVTALPSVRPAFMSPGSAVSLVLFIVSVSCTATLPLSLIVRRGVARVLERAPSATSRSALLTIERTGVRPSRIKARFVRAVTVPVAFIAIGTTLLASAHTRRADRDGMLRTVSILEQGALSPVSGSCAGCRAAAEVLATHGFRFSMSRAEPAGAEHEIPLRALDERTLSSGELRLLESTSPLEPTLLIYAGLALMFSAIAARLGMAIGESFQRDVQLVTRELKSTGVADVLRGTRILRHTRLSSFQTLMRAVEELSAVFRQFAAAQEKAIAAKEATNRMRGLFLTSMSHDLRAPLNAVLGFAELASRHPLSDGQRESLAIIEQRGKELLGLIETILDSGRAEEGELEMVPDWVKVGDIVMAAVLDAREGVPMEGVDVVGEVQPGVPLLFLDSLRIVQALTAVITNAMRLTREGTVVVRATLPAASEELYIDVEARGRGIPALERERVFDAFHNAESARRHGSLGLGLLLCRAIITAHGGTIEVQTTSAGNVLFRLGLPTDGNKVAARTSKNRQRSATPPPSQV